MRCHQRYGVAGEIERIGEIEGNRGKLRGNRGKYSPIHSSLEESTLDTTVAVQD